MIESLTRSVRDIVDKVVPRVLYGRTVDLWPNGCSEVSRYPALVNSIPKLQYLLFYAVYFLRIAFFEDAFDLRRSNVLQTAKK